MPKNKKMIEDRPLPQEYRFKIEHLLDDYPKYKPFLKGLKIYETTDNMIAAIDVEHGIMYIGKKHINDPKEYLSMYVRHELLHKILKHDENATKKYAKELGIDLENQSLEDKKKIMAELIRDNFKFRQYSASNARNVSGDLDLSRYYSDEDKKIVEEIGGFLLDDIPGIENFTYDELIDWCRISEDELLSRLYPTSKGHIDDKTGEWVETESIPGQFQTNIINKEDILKVDAPTAEFFNCINRTLYKTGFKKYTTKNVRLYGKNPDGKDIDVYLPIWTKDSLFIGKDGYNIVYSVDGGKVFKVNTASKNSFFSKSFIVPVFKVDNIDLYLQGSEEIKAERIGKSLESTVLYCCGFPCIVAYKKDLKNYRYVNYLISLTPVSVDEFSDFQRAHSYDYDDSLVKDTISEIQIK